MNLGLFFSHLDTVVEQADAQSIRDALKIIVPYGIRYVDVDGANIGITHEVKEIKDYLDEFEVKTASVFHFVDFDWKNENILNIFKEQTKKQLEYCAYLDTNIFNGCPQYSVCAYK